MSRKVDRWRFDQPDDVILTGNAPIRRLNAFPPIRPIIPVSIVAVSACAGALLLYALPKFADRPVEASVAIEGAIIDKAQAAEAPEPAPQPAPPPVQVASAAAPVAEHAIADAISRSFAFETKLSPLPATSTRWAMASSPAPALARMTATSEVASDAEPADGLAAFVPTPRPAPPVAESEAEVRVMETAMARQDPEAFKVEKKPSPTPVSASTAGMITGSVRTAVNMRAGGADEARVLQVVPAGARISMAEGCRHWCTVIYKGRKGYIYKSFLRRE